MAKKKAVPLPRSLSLEAAEIFAETAFFTAQGMERRMAANGGGRAYVLTPEARDYWLTRHARSIPHALKKFKPSWKKDRSIVLPMAQQLGERAADHAIADAGTDNPIQVLKKHVQAASLEVAADPHCRSARIKAAGPSSGGGSGIYCEV